MHTQHTIRPTGFSAGPPVTPSLGDQSGELGDERLCSVYVRHQTRWRRDGHVEPPQVRHVEQMLGRGSQHGGEFTHTGDADGVALSFAPLGNRPLVDAALLSEHAQALARARDAVVEPLWKEGRGNNHRLGGVRMHPYTVTDLSAPTRTVSP